MTDQQQTAVSNAAKTIFDSLTDESFSPAEKIATVKELGKMIRNEIDESVRNLTELRATI